MHALPELSPRDATPTCTAVPSHWRLPADDQSVPQARRLVTAAIPAYLHQGGADQRSSPITVQEFSDTFALMASELVANAVTHVPTDDRFVEMTLWRADGMLWLAVSDCGEVFRPRRSVPPDPLTPVYPDLEADHGRGLYLVEALADVWAVIPRPTVGKSVIAGLWLAVEKDIPDA